MLFRSSPSLCGTGVILYLDHDAKRLIMVPTLCHRWDCPTCGRSRLAKARAMAVAGSPERIITLTTRPRQGLSTEAAVKWLRGRWTALLRRLRRNFPRLEYMAFLELHKSGWPHLHVLTRGCYVPQRMLSAWWLKLTGSFKVHIQKVDHTWTAVHEATKYCLKTARQVHDACPALPVYTTSKGWLPDDWAEGDKPAGDYAFYCFCRLSWADAQDMLSDLGITSTPIPDSPGHYELTRPAPIPCHLTDLTYSVGSWPEKELLSALDLFFGDPDRAFADPDGLTDRQEYAAAPDLGVSDAPDPYTEPEPTCPELPPQLQRPLFEQTPAPVAFS